MNEEEILENELSELLEEQEKAYKHLWDVQDDIERTKYKLVNLKEDLEE